MIVMSIMVCLLKKSFKTFFRTIWMYLSVILSDLYAMRINSHFNRLFAGIWLLFCTLLLSLISGNLWDALVRPQPMAVIETWEDLYYKPEWKGLEIWSLKYFEFYEFINSENSSMSRDFKNRTIFEDPLEFAVERNLYPKDIEKWARGEQVMAFDSLASHWVKNYHKHSIENLGYKEGYDFHISELGTGMKPYFMLTVPRFNDTLLFQLNKV